MKEVDVMKSLACNLLIEMSTAIMSLNFGHLRQREKNLSLGWKSKRNAVTSYFET
jgi:hypothetical protein